MYVNIIFIMQILNIFINKISQKRQQMHTCKNSTNHLSYFCFPTSELPGIDSRVWKFHEYIMSCDIKVHLYGIITWMFIMVFMKKKKTVQYLKFFNYFGVIFTFFPIEMAFYYFRCTDNCYLFLIWKINFVIWKLIFSGNLK